MGCIECAAVLGLAIYRNGRKDLVVATRVVQVASSAFCVSSTLPLLCVTNAIPASEPAEAIEYLSP